MLYHPAPVNVAKYQRFYQKLFQLTESNKYISNVFVRTIDGIDLDTIYIKNLDTNKCIIFFHGNAGNISMRFDMIKFLYNFASVIIFDYRSFGKSSGSTSDLSANTLQKDAEAIWNYATNVLGINPNNISLFGESLGCSVAIRLAAELSKTMNNNHYPHSVICNSPFSSLSSMVNFVFKKINIGLLGKIVAYIIAQEYCSTDYIKYINHQTKLIISHSPRDEIIPYEQGLQLYHTISQIHPNIKFVNITGTHNNFGLTDQYIYALADLFDG